MPGRTVQWKSDTQFNFGTPIFNDIVVKGSGDAAYLELDENTPNSDDVPFTTPANYTYDGNKIVVVGGKAKLKATIAGETNYPFTTPANYTYDVAKIEVSGGIAKIKAGAPLDYEGYYRFEDNVEDSSGNGHHGTNHGVTFVSGKLGKAGEFDGNSYVNCGDFGLTPTNYTIEFWSKRGTIPNYKSPISLSSNYDAMLWVYENGDVAFGSASGGWTKWVGVWTDKLDFHYIVVLVDTSTNKVRLYFDNVDQGLKTSSVQGSWTHVNIGGKQSHWIGLIDEVALYTRELSQSEINDHYNSGNGKVLGQYHNDNPPIACNNGYTFGIAINEFSEIATKPAGTDIKYHVSSDDGTTWKYWNGSSWIVTDDTYTKANEASVINNNIYSLASIGTFKFRALLHSDGTHTPELDNIYLAEGAIYPIGSHEISMNNDIQPGLIASYLSTTENVIKPTDTYIKYQYSIDGGLTWNGSWFTEPQLETAIKLITCNFDGMDKIRFKMQLSTTNNIKTPEIDNLNVVSHSGYKTSGNYTSTIFNVYSVGQWGVVGWETLTFDKVEPTNTTIAMKQRTSTYALDKYGKFTIVASGDNLDTESNIFQFKVDMTGNGQYTPKLNLLEVEYCLGIFCKDKLADAIWDAILADHTVAGSAGEKLGDALGQYDAGGSIRGNGGGSERIVADTGKKSPWSFKQKEEVRKNIKAILEIVTEIQKEVKNKDVALSVNKKLEDISKSVDSMTDELDNKEILISMKKALNHVTTLAEKKDDKKLVDIMEKLNDLYWLYLKSIPNKDLEKVSKDDVEK